MVHIKMPTDTFKEHIIPLKNIYLLMTNDVSVLDVLKAKEIITCNSSEQARFKELCSLECTSTDEVAHEEYN